MKKRQVMVLAGAISLWLITAINGAAWEGKGWSEDRMEKKHEMMMKINEELGLSEEQNAQIKAHHDRLKEEQKSLRAQIKEKRAMLKDTLDKEGATKQEVDRIADELIALIGRRIKNRVNGIWATKSVLTPDQFRLFQEKRGELKEKFREHRHSKGDES